MLPGRKDRRAPASGREPAPPQRTPSRAGGSLTMVMSRSDKLATSSGELASLAPAATSDSAREAVRFQTVKEYPAFKRFNPIGRPIRPSPINPTFEPGPMIRFGLGLLPGPILTPGLMLVVGRVSRVTKSLLRAMLPKAGPSRPKYRVDSVDCNRIGAKACCRGFGGRLSSGGLGTILEWKD